MKKIVLLIIVMSVPIIEALSQPRFEDLDKTLNNPGYQDTIVSLTAAQEKNIQVLIDSAVMLVSRLKILLAAQGYTNNGDILVGGSSVQIGGRGTQRAYWCSYVVQYGWTGFRYYTQKDGTFSFSLSAANPHRFLYGRESYVPDMKVHLNDPYGNFVRYLQRQIAILIDELKLVERKAKSATKK